MRVTVVLTDSFFVSLSRSTLVTVWFTLRARDNAISPAVLISFSLRSKRSSLGLSATASAKATAPVQRLKHEKIYTKENHYEQGSAKFLILHLKKIVMMYQCWYIKMASQYCNPKINVSAFPSISISYPVLLLFPCSIISIYIK